MRWHNSHAVPLSLINTKEEEEERPLTVIKRANIPHTALMTLRI